MIVGVENYLLKLRHWDYGMILNIAIIPTNPWWWVINPRGSSCRGSWRRGVGIGRFGSGWVTARSGSATRHRGSSTVTVFYAGRSPGAPVGIRADASVRAAGRCPEMDVVEIGALPEPCGSWSARAGRHVCGSGVVPHRHGTREVELVDLSVFGRPARLLWRKQRWRCRRRRS